MHGRKSDDATSAAYVPSLFDHIKRPAKRKADIIFILYMKVEPTHDIGRVHDFASIPECSPCQPACIQFPVTYYSDKAWSFNSKWFQQYSWLEYSVKMLLIDTPVVCLT